MKLQELFPNGSLAVTAKPKPTALVTLQDDPSVDCEDWVISYNGIWATSSLMVAKVFGKPHKSIIRAIEEHVDEMYPLEEENLVAQNCAAKYFIEATYENRGKAYKMYYLTKDGLSLLVMGFTGKQALIYKMLYIARFNELEERDKAKQLGYSEMATMVAKATAQAITEALPGIIKAVQESQLQAATAPLRIADASLAGLPDTLTVKQVRIYLGVSFDRAYSLFHSTDFPSYNIGRSLYVNKAEFMQWLSLTSKQGIFLG
ncbi:MAG: Rha family transcriptional regulator [Hydrogenoanaerobacterium sp.]